MPHSVIVHEFFNRAQPRKALICRLHDNVRHSSNHFVTEAKHNHGEAHSGSSPFCYWGQTQAWLHALTEQPNFWTRAIRMWSHNASHRANRKLWLRALSVLAYFVRVGAGRFFRQHHKAQYTHAKKVFWGNSPKYFRRIPGRMGSHRPIISASAHTSKVILHHTVFNWTLRQGSILFTIYQSVLHSRYCL